MAKRRISRKKLLKEPDEFLDFSQRVWLRISESPGKAAAVAGGVLGLLLVLIVVLHLVERAREQRLSTVAQAIGNYLSVTGSVQDSVKVQQELESLAKKYAGNDVGGLALFFLGGAFSKSGDYPRAVEAYQNLLKKDIKNTCLEVMSTVALGYTYSLMGDGGKALETFQALLERKDVAVPRSQIQMDVARLYEEKGDFSQAAATYRRLIESAPESVWSAQAERRLQLIEGAQKPFTM